MQKFSHGLAFSLAAVSAMVLASSAAHATEGYFQHGYGARSKALGGTGAADSRDATATSLNPAGLVHVEDQADIAISVFSPHREFEGGAALGPTFTPVGTVESDSNYFFIPNLAVSYRLAPNPFVDVIGFSVYGNGGMNTDYPAVARAFPPGATGVFLGGRAGVNLQQALVSVAFAKQAGPLAFGIAPILAYQQFEAEGLEQAFGVKGSVTDRSFGFGVRGGIEWSVTSNFRVGVAGNTRIWSQEFDDYAGLFAEQGAFDIPASVQAGVAFDVTKNLTLLADYRHIWFGSVKSIANPSTNQTPLGSDNGPGFGWDDVDVVKLGVEWRTSPDLTLRAGYSHATNPIGERDVLFNILAPAVVQDHITAGLEYRLSSTLSLELAGLYAPEETVSGVDASAPFAAHAIDISMYQY
jgi:long-chain fatty acid transport protein